MQYINKMQQTTLTEVSSGSSYLVKFTTQMKHHEVQINKPRLIKSVHFILNISTVIIDVYTPCGPEELFPLCGRPGSDPKHQLL